MSQFDEIYNTDPIQLLNMTEKYVQIESVVGTSQVGFVYTVDPVTKSYVLIRSTENGSIDVLIIPGCSIKTVTEIAAPENMKMPDLKLTHSTESKKSDVDFTKRKNQLVSWFSKHLIKLEECPNNSDLLMYKDVMSIQPPYKTEDLLSNNEIILAKMQDLLKSMPDDYTE
ncbi:Gem (Nuclear organelle) associated protein 6 [Chamberlinius hualienensis]